MNEPFALTLTPPDNLPLVGRKKLDQYFTPPALATAAVGWLAKDGYLWPEIYALEPSAGAGAWVDAVVAVAGEGSCTALDIDPMRVADLRARGIPTLDACDFLTFGDIGLTCYELLIGNPPYSGAEAHVRRALALRARFGVVAFLLRLAFLESDKRVAFWQEHPASKVYVLSERPSFANGKTDNAAYGVFVWASWHRGPTQIEVMQWKNV